METMSHNLEFGFFADLGAEEHSFVSSILQNASCKGLELSWDPAEYMTVGVYQPLVNGPSSGISFGTVPPNLGEITSLPVPDGPQWQPNDSATPPSQGTPSQSDSDRPNGQSDIQGQNMTDNAGKQGLRQYERRNKKKRPPGYYDNISRPPTGIDQTVVGSGTFPSQNFVPREQIPVGTHVRPERSVDYPPGLLVGSGNQHFSKHPQESMVNLTNLPSSTPSLSQQFSHDVGSSAEKPMVQAPKNPPQMSGAPNRFVQYEQDSNKSASYGLTGYGPPRTNIDVQGTTVSLPHETLGGQQGFIPPHVNEGSMEHQKSNQSQVDVNADVRIATVSVGDQFGSVHHDPQSIEASQGPYITQTQSARATHDGITAPSVKSGQSEGVVPPTTGDSMVQQDLISEQHSAQVHNGSSTMAHQTHESLQMSSGTIPSTAHASSSVTSTTSYQMDQMQARSLTSPGKEQNVVGLRTSTLKNDLPKSLDNQRSNTPQVIYSGESGSVSSLTSPQISGASREDSVLNQNASLQHATSPEGGAAANLAQSGTPSSSFTVPSESKSAQPSGDGDTAASQAVPSQPRSGAPVPVAAKPKPSSWAGLFKSSSSASPSSSSVPYVSHVNSGGSTGVPQSEEDKDRLPVIVSVNEDNAARRLGDLLAACLPVYTPVMLQPRGLSNRANWCYINATLQALLACPPFYHLIKSLPKVPQLERGPSSTPVMDSLIQFVNEFMPMKQKPTEIKPVGGHKGAKGPVMIDLHPGSVFEPTYVYQMLQVIKYDAAFKHGHQEDAEEFLSCVLNGLHDEMVAAIKLVNPKEKTPEEPDPSPNGQLAENVSYDADDEDDQWEQVGPKNKSVITRAAHFSKSPISEIFGGQIRSILHQSGLKESATLQPFFTLQLDTHADNVWNVKDALELLVSKEALQGYTSSKTKQEVEASRRITLESLPPVLVLHLKCFVYDKHGGCQKVMRKVDFETNLEISKDLLSGNTRSKYTPQQRSYKLTAVVNHHGARAVGGHYSADIYHPGVEGWVRCDDSLIKAVTIQQVLKYAPPRVPYLLYYRRADTC